jgi:mRNA interferase RelE/StbE
MSYRVVLRRSAARELEDLTQPIRRRVTRAIGTLAADPRPTGSKLLTGPERIWRLRVGDYRILYRINDDMVEVLVIRVRHRGEAYR